MRLSFATSPGSPTRPTEDFLAATPRVVVVVDGLSSPPELGSGCLHGTPWYAAQIATRIGHEATCRPGDPLADCVADALSQVAEAHSGTCDLSHPGTPSSSVALLREGVDTVDYLSIFDSVIVLDGPDGMQVITDLRADAFAQDEHKETLRHEIGTPGHQRAVSLLVAAQRPHRNKPDGYWVAGAVRDAAHNAVTGSLPRSSVTRAAVLSDGASCLVDDYGLADWGRFMTLLQEEGPERVIARVRRAEASDPTGSRWPRYKAGDDSTVVLCTFED